MVLDSITAMTILVVNCEVVDGSTLFADRCFQNLLFIVMKDDVSPASSDESFCESIYVDVFSVSLPQLFWYNTPIKTILYKLIMAILIFDYVLERALDWLKGSRIGQAILAVLDGLYCQQKYDTQQLYQKTNTAFLY